MERPLMTQWIPLEVKFIADDKGAYTSSIGLLFDASPRLGGPRAKVISVLFKCSCLLTMCALRSSVM